MQQMSLFHALFERCGRGAEDAGTAPSGPEHELRTLYGVVFPCFLWWGLVRRQGRRCTEGCADCSHLRGPCSAPLLRSPGSPQAVSALPRGGTIRRCGERLQHCSEGTGEFCEDLHSGGERGQIISQEEAGRHVHSDAGLRPKRHILQAEGGKEGVFESLFVLFLFRERRGVVERARKSATHPPRFWFFKILSRWWEGSHHINQIAKAQTNGNIHKTNRTHV